MWEYCDPVAYAWRVVVLDMFVNVKYLVEYVDQEQINEKLKNRVLGILTIGEKSIVQSHPLYNKLDVFRSESAQL
jgi:hypothetical protein